MEEKNDIRRGHHCVFNMHVHLVFRVKYRCKVFDSAAIDRLPELFAKVCLERRIQSRAAKRKAGHRQTLLLQGRAVVTFLLRILLRRRSDQHHSSIH